MAFAQPAANADRVADSTQMATPSNAASTNPEPSKLAPSNGAEAPRTVRIDANGDGRPDRAGERVTVAGRVSSEPGRISGDVIAIQSEGWGITIVTGGGAEVVRGDSLVAVGVVEHENGRTQVRADSYSVLPVPPRIPEPTAISLGQAIGERYESMVVEVTGRVDRRDSNRGGNYLTLKAPGSGDVLTIFVPNHRLDDISVAGFDSGEMIRVSGPLQQHDYTSPFTNYYEIVPRDKADLTRTARSRTFYRNAFLIGALVILLSIGAVVLLRAQVRRRTRELAESQRRLRRLAEATFEGVVIHRDGRILDVNSAITDLMGYRKDELLGEDALTFVSGSTRSIVATHIAEGSEDPYECVLVRKDGTTFPADIQAKIVESENGTLRVAAIRDASQRKNNEAELLLAKQEAEQVAKLKSSLLNNMSHELRTPITSIIGYAELIMEEPPEVHDLFARRIRQSGRRLSDTLRSVLDMAQIEAGTMDLHVADVDTGRLASEVIAAHEPMAQEKDVALYLDADDAPVLATDRILCYRILTNLVHNALKFTDKGHVRVTVTESAPGVMFSVQDTGIGIDESFLPHLFEPFKQESNGRTRTHDGTGLGLAITKRMVDLLSGHINVSSSKNEGTTITVDLSPSLQHEGGPMLTSGHTARPELGDALPDHIAQVTSPSNGHAHRGYGPHANEQESAHPQTSDPSADDRASDHPSADDRPVGESST